MLMLLLPLLHSLRTLRKIFLLAFSLPSRLPPVTTQKPRERKCEKRGKIESKSRVENAYFHAIERAFFLSLCHTILCSHFLSLGLICFWFVQCRGIFPSPSQLFIITSSLYVTRMLQSNFLLLLPMLIVSQK